jgi:hypothetical protein
MALKDDKNWQFTTLTYLNLKNSKYHKHHSDFWGLGCPMALAQVHSCGQSLLPQNHVESSCTEDRA